MKPRFTLTNERCDQLAGALEILGEGLWDARQGFLNEARTFPADVPKTHRFWRVLRLLERAQEDIREAQSYTRVLAEHSPGLPPPEGMGDRAETWLRRRKPDEGEL